MSTSTSTFTFTHTVVFMTDNLLHSLLRIITNTGLNPQKLTSDWSVLSNGIKTWIQSGHFKTSVLEIYNPIDSRLVGRWDLKVSYNFNESEMWTDINAIKYAISKAGLYPQSCHYRIVITTEDGRPDVPGFRTTNLRSTEGLTKFSIGTTIGAGSLGGSASYWR